jgi:N-acetylmuramoyl-L-alanine amidase
VLGETGFVGDSVEHSTLPGYTRIAIRLDRERKVECRRLISPARLYCDIDGVRISTAGPVEHFTGDALLEAMRVGALRPDQARIVFDLKSASVRHVVAVVPNPPRLLVEIVNLSTLGIRSSDPRETPVETAPGNQKRIRQEGTTQQPPAQITQAFPGSVGGPVSAVSKSEPDFLKPDLLKPGLLKEERIVVIDPGHGGHDNGSIGPGGLHEKDLVLDVAKRLGELLRAQPGVRVIFTRTTDEFLALEERSAIANRAHAGIFVSIHGNASPYAPAEGIETYYLGYSDASRDLVVAERENRRQPRSVPAALADESHSGSEAGLVQQQGKQLAEDVQRALHTAAAEAGDIRNRGVRMAPFFVLKNVKAPAILAEVAFLTSPTEERKLMLNGYRQQLAEGLFRGISANLARQSARSSGRVTASVGHAASSLASASSASSSATMVASGIAAAHSMR